MTNLTTTYAGLELKNPIIASSSGLTDSVENIKKLAEAGVGAVVLKSIFEEEILMEMEEMKQEMIARPFVFPETMDYMDEEPHEDIIRKHLRLIRECKEAVDIPIIVSINAISNQKWTYLATEIEKAGADAIELNLFALPSDVTKNSEEIEKTYREIVETVVKLVNIPVTIKMSYYYTAMGSVIKAYAKTGVKGIVLFNRYFSSDIDIDKEQLSSAFILSSNNDIALPMRWVSLMYHQVDVDLSATTGIHKSKDVIKLLLSGAATVQIATALYKNDFTIVQEMLDYLKKWMIGKGYKSIAEFRGNVSFTSKDNAASWERVQFMKEFTQFIK